MLTQGWGRCRALWVWAVTHFWRHFRSGCLGVSALMESRMVKFLLQTSALLWPQHQGAYIQHFLPLYIQPGQIVQQCFEHPCSATSWHPSGNLVFSLVSLIILLLKPSLLCVLDTNRLSGSEPKQAQLSMPYPSMSSTESLDKGVKSRTNSLQELPYHLLAASHLP